MRLGVFIVALAALAQSSSACRDRQLATSSVERAVERAYTEHAHRLASQSGLPEMPELSPASDYLELRMWSGGGLATINGYRIARTKGQWTAELIVEHHMTSQCVGNDCHTVASPDRLVRLQPRHGWERVEGLTKELIQKMAQYRPGDQTAPVAKDGAWKVLEAVSATGRLLVAATEHRLRKGDAIGILTTAQQIALELRE